MGDSEQMHGNFPRDFGSGSANFAITGLTDSMHASGFISTLSATRGVPAGFEPLAVMSANRLASLPSFPFSRKIRPQVRTAGCHRPGIRDVHHPAEEGPPAGKPGHPSSGQSGIEEKFGTSIIRRRRSYTF